MQFRLPWQRSPEPPPPLPNLEWWFGGPGYTLGAFILWSIYTRGCIALERGHLGRLQPHHAKYTFWCFPLAVLVHAVSYFSESHGVAEVDFLSSLSGKTLDRSLLLYLGCRVMPIAAFGMMLVSEISVLIFARGFPRMTFAYMRYPVMSVHATSLFYYLVELFLTTHTMIDAFGRPIYPLRYVMWTCSVSCMMISVYYVVECQHRHMRADLATLRRLHHDLAVGLLCVNGTFTAGFLAGRPWGDRRHINAICFMTSTACFYSMLGCIDRMLVSTQERAEERMPGVAWQFAVTRNAVFLVWHLFPIVWALAAADAISVEVEHMGYVASDMAAKFLLLFVYIASVNNHSTVDVTLDLPARTAAERDPAHPGRPRASVGRATSTAHSGGRTPAGRNGAAAVEREHGWHSHTSQPPETDGMGSMADGSADGTSRPCRTSTAVHTVVGTRVA